MMTELAEIYLGREHFIALVAEREGQKFGIDAARRLWGQITIRKAYPNDTRKPDMEAAGLIFARRSEVGIEPLPVFAQYGAENSRELASTEVCGDLVISLGSMSDFVERVVAGEAPRPNGMGLLSIKFLQDLVELHTVREQ